MHENGSLSGPEDAAEQMSFDVNVKFRVDDADWPGSVDNFLVASKTHY